MWLCEDLYRLSCCMILQKHTSFNDYRCKSFCFARSLRYNVLRNDLSPGEALLLSNRLQPGYLQWCCSPLSCTEMLIQGTQCKRMDGWRMLWSRCSIGGRVVLSSHCNNPLVSWFIWQIFQRLMGWLKITQLLLFNVVKYLWQLGAEQLPYFVDSKYIWSHITKHSMKLFSKSYYF